MGVGLRPDDCPSRPPLYLQTNLILLTLELPPQLLDMALTLLHLPLFKGQVSHKLPLFVLKFIRLRSHLVLQSGNDLLILLRVLVVLLILLQLFLQVPLQLFIFPLSLFQIGNLPNKILQYDAQPAILVEKHLFFNLVLVNLGVLHHLFNPLIFKSQRLVLLSRIPHDLLQVSHNHTLLLNTLTVTSPAFPL
jgi:hypothetical protein